MGDARLGLVRFTTFWSNKGSPTVGPSDFRPLTNASRRRYKTKTSVAPTPHLPCPPTPHCCAAYALISTFASCLPTMPAPHMLSYDARRRALLSSSYSPKLPDASQFPLSAILAKLPLLPDDPILDAPAQQAFPTPPTPPTPPIDTGLAQPQVAGDSFRPAFKTVPLPPDDDDNNNNNLRAHKKKRLLDSRSIAWWTRFDSGSDNRLKLKTSSDKKDSKRFLASRSIAWWTRF